MVPSYREGLDLIQAIDRLTKREDIDQVVIVDGEGDTPSQLVALGLKEHLRTLRDDRLVQVRCDRIGRARQMNLGAAQCSGDILIFLHVDTQLPGVDLRECFSMAENELLWGWFRVRLDDEGLLLRVVAWMMNIRSGLTGVGTGDQAIFVQKSLFEQESGFAEIELMEDIELCRRLKRVTRPSILKQSVVTSARRWREGGAVRTIVRMWVLRLLYWLGVSPGRLADYYRHVR